MLLAASTNTQPIIKQNALQPLNNHGAAKTFPTLHLTSTAKRLILFASKCALESILPGFNKTTPVSALGYKNVVRISVSRTGAVEGSRSSGLDDNCSIARL